jgi:hypothetical protein
MTSAYVSSRSLTSPSRRPWWFHRRMEVEAAFANDIGAQLIGGRLEGGDIVNRHKPLSFLRKPILACLS